MTDLSARAARLLSAPTVALSLSLVVMPIVVVEGADPESTEVADASPDGDLDGLATDDAASEELSDSDDGSGAEAAEPDEISDEESSETEEETSEEADGESVEDGSGDVSAEESDDGRAGGGPGDESPGGPEEDSVDQTGADEDVSADVSGDVSEGESSGSEVGVEDVSEGGPGDGAEESVEDGSGDVSAGESDDGRAGGGPRDESPGGPEEDSVDQTAAVEDVSAGGSGDGVEESEDGAEDVSGDGVEESEEVSGGGSGDGAEESVEDGSGDVSAGESDDGRVGAGPDDESPGGPEEDSVDQTAAVEDVSAGGSGDGVEESEDGAEDVSGEMWSRSVGGADDRASGEHRGDGSGEESSDLVEEGSGEVPRRPAGPEDHEGPGGESGDRVRSDDEEPGGRGPSRSVDGLDGGSAGETSDVGEGVIRDEAVRPSESEALSSTSGPRMVPGGGSAESSSRSSGPVSENGQSRSVAPAGPNASGVASPSSVGTGSERASGGGLPKSGVDPVPTSAPATHRAPNTLDTSSGADGQGSTGQVSPVAETAASPADGGSLPDQEPVTTPSPAPAAEPSTSGTGAAASSREGPIVESTEVAQSAGVERRAVAVAESGSNTIDADTPAVPERGSRGSTIITTGDATVVGNDSRTNLSQEVVTSVGGRSHVEVVQIAITFNIGAALAISGLNSSTTGEGMAADVFISTGNALAIGNDAESYLTQAGAAGADGRDTATTSQRSTLVNISVSTANSGANIVIVAGSGVGSGGTIVSGNATALGNRSTTDVAQRAVADARGSSNISIEQTAVILNLGVALANTGANQVGQAVRSLIVLSEGGVAGNLFEILLPILLETARSAQTGVPGGGGVIETGDAVAIGNRSRTESEQVAVAIAEQSGSVEITQDVFVANAGAATATTGANAVGGELTNDPPRLDGEAQEAISALSSYLDGLLAQIEFWRTGLRGPLAGGDALVVVDDIRIGVRIDLGSHEAMVRGPAGLVSLVRQLTAVIDIGLAVADSGGNTIRSAEPVPPVAGSASGGGATSRRAPEPTSASVVPLGVPTRMAADDATTPETASPLAAPSKVAARQFERLADNVVRRFGLEIRTGDASAVNSSLTVICLRASLPGHECLAPEEVTQPGDPGRRAASAADPAPTRAAPANLAATGGDSYTMLLVAAALLGSGLVLLAGSRRRETGADRRR